MYVCMYVLYYFFRSGGIDFSIPREIPGTKIRPGDTVSLNLVSESGTNTQVRNPTHFFLPIRLKMAWIFWKYISNEGILI